MTASTFTAISGLLDGADQVGRHHFTNNRTGYWAKGFGGFGRTQGDSVEDYGGIAGYGEAINNQTTLGAAFVGTGTGTSAAQQTVESKSFGGFVYAIDTVGRLRISATLGAGYQHQDSTRYLTPTPLIGYGSTSGWYMGTGVQAQYLIPMGHAFLIPYGKIRYQYSRLGSFSEQGAAGDGVNLNIGYGSLATSVAAFSGGLRLGEDVTMPDATVIPWVGIGGTGYAGTLHVTQAESVGLLNSTESGLVAPGGALDADVGLTIKGKRSPWSVKVAYNGQYSGNTHLNTFGLLANYRW